MNKTNQWDEELSRLVEIIEKTGLTKTIKWGAPVYTYKGKNIVSLAGFKNHFTLWLYGGVFLKDKYRVLINAQEGKTKSLRQWRFYSSQEIDENKILTYLQEAIKNAEEGKTLKPEKFKAVKIPEILKRELDSNQNLNSAFKQFAPGKQKEYNLYIEEAKQEKTKASRLEKIKPMILNGIGLNDQYK